MIKVSYSKSDGFYNNINIIGHANFDEYGSDIVCAGVSTLVYAIGNKILNINEDFDLKINENEFNFINDGHNRDINLLIETLVEGLYMVNEGYGSYINIKEVKHD